MLIGEGMDVRSRPLFDSLITRMLHDWEFRNVVFSGDAVSVKEILEGYSQPYLPSDPILEIPIKICELPDSYERFAQFVSWASKKFGFS